MERRFGEGIARECLNLKDPFFIQPDSWDPETNTSDVKSTVDDRFTSLERMNYLPSHSLSVSFL